MSLRKTCLTKADRRKHKKIIKEYEKYEKKKNKKSSFIPPKYQLGQIIYRIKKEATPYIITCKAYDGGKWNYYIYQCIVKRNLPRL
jgi:hypothetical protein